MVKRKDVAALIDTLRELADEGAKGRAARTRIAAKALESVDVKANPELARDRLADELAPVLENLLAEVTRLEGEDPDADAEGLLWLDLALVRVLESVDADSAAMAREGRTAKAHEPELRWELWTDTMTPHGVVRLAGVVWSRRVLERWRRAVDQPAAMVRAVAEPLLRLSQGATLDEAKHELVDARGERIAGRKPDDPEMAAMPIEAVRRGLTAWRSTTARRLVRFLALEAHAGEVRGDLRPDRVHVSGGLVGLAERIGAHSGNAANIVRDALNLGRWVDLTIPGGLEVRGLWTWNQRAPEAPGKPRVLTVNLNDDVFLSGAASDMKATMGDATRGVRRARLLVPVLRHEVPFRVGNRAERGAVWSVADAVLVLLVDRARDLANEGGVRIEAQAWRELVTDAGLDEGRATAVRDLLLEGDGEAGPMLKSVGADRYTLADAHASELAFIVARVDSGVKATKALHGELPNSGKSHRRRGK